MRTNTPSKKKKTYPKKTYPKKNNEKKQDQQKKPRNEPNGKISEKKTHTHTEDQTIEKKKKIQWTLPSHMDTAWKFKR